MKKNGNGKLTAEKLTAELHDPANPYIADAINATVRGIDYLRGKKVKWEQEVLQPGFDLAQSRTSLDHHILELPQREMELCGFVANATVVREHGAGIWYKTVTAVWRTAATISRPDLAEKAAQGNRRSRKKDAVTWATGGFSPAEVQYAS